VTARERTVHLDWSTILPHQRALLTWEPPAGLTPGPVTEAALGGWGSGKTYAQGMRFAYLALGAGWHAGYGKRRPQAIVVGPNLRLACRNQLELIDSLLPSEFVKQRWTNPSPRLLLQNGLEIHAIGADSRYEGESLVMCWCDEIQHHVYGSDPTLFTNLIARLRDPKTRMRHPRMLVSGLPTAGFVKDTFDRPKDPRLHLQLWASKQNTRLAAGIFDEIQKATPYGQEDVYLRGQWTQHPDALYPQYRPDQHLVDDPGNQQQPVSIGVDVGNRSAVVIGQRRIVPGTSETRLHVVDEVLGDGLSVEELMSRFAETRWALVPGKSEICVDPTLRRDELAPIRRRWPSVVIVQRERSDPYYDVAAGVRVVQAALRSSTGQTRLSFARHLGANRRGVIESLTALRYNPRTGAMVTDDLRDHPNDALRYLSTVVLGRQIAPPEITRR
jgi:hypothetical protein